MTVAADLCVYTNHNFVVETVEVIEEAEEEEEEEKGTGKDKES